MCTNKQSSGSLHSNKQQAGKAHLHSAGAPGAQRLRNLKHRFIDLRLEQGLVLDSAQAGREHAKGHDERGQEAGDEECDNPADGGLEQHAPRDALVALEQADKQRGADLQSIYSKLHT